MRRMAVLACLGTAMTPLSAQQATPSQTPTDPVAALVALEGRVEAAVVRGDVTFLDSTYATDFRFTHGTGVVQTKTQWLEVVRTLGGASEGNGPACPRPPQAAV
ncbi:MAG TPA: nuclear transport factor 2 family protein [Gemmatimonadales bacterium]|nr:nuclear transport factor 2 family protein [Gemmatimonadales bacterium]